MQYITLSISFFLFISIASAQQYKELARINAPEAKQAVAADSNFVYVIHNHKIVKRNKTNFQIEKQWNGGENGAIKHLNSGVVVNAKLYCAHSNYPHIPMTSSIEIFNTKTLEHIDSVSFGIYKGSCTWIDFNAGYWWIMFAHYENRSQQANRNVSWTSLVKMDTAFRTLESWILPQQLIEVIRPYSISGGIMLNSKQLICTGHHNQELYLLQIPPMGSTLLWLNTFPIPFKGQGIARDPEHENIFYGINKTTRELIKADFSDTKFILK